MFATFSDYQVRARETAVYEEELAKQIAALVPQGVVNTEAADVLLRNRCLDYCALGLTGEAGELANIVKKVARDDGGVVTPERRDALLEEIGGVLWYLAQLCTELRMDLGSVAAANIAQLRARKAAGTIHGHNRPEG